MIIRGVLIAGCAVWSLVDLGCGGDDDPPLSDATELSCPFPESPLPFAIGDTEWRFNSNEDESSASPRIKHQPNDILGNPAVGFANTDRAGDVPIESGRVAFRGTMARVDQNRGLFAEEIAGELVSLWEYSDAAGWEMLGEAVTGDFSDPVPGGYEFAGGDLADQPEVQLRYAVLNAEPSCAKHFSFTMATGRQVVFADIDGTLTLNDDELLTQVADGTYDPAEKQAAADVMQAWAAKGYQVIYLTARPHVFRSETRAWLDDHGYPIGPVITANELIFGDGARDYKTAWVTRVGTELAWDIVAAYGNATSDIDAYEAAGVPKDATFIIGPNAGMTGTVAIENDDYTSHLANYVAAQPDAN